MSHSRSAECLWLFFVQGFSVDPVVLLSDKNDETSLGPVIQFQCAAIYISLSSQSDTDMIEK